MTAVRNAKLYADARKLTEEMVELEAVFQQNLIAESAGGFVGFFLADGWLKGFDDRLNRCIEYLELRSPEAAERIWRERNQYLTVAMSDRRRAVATAHRAEKLWAEGHQHDAWAVGDDVAEIEARRAMSLAAAAALDRLWNAHGYLCNPLAGDRGPTVETVMKPARIDPIGFLVATGELSEDNRRSAVQIAWLYEAVTSVVAARTSAITAAGRAPRGGGRPETSMQENAALLHASVYLPWTRELKRQQKPVDLVLSVVVQGRSIADVARRHRMGRARAIKTLRAALNSYGRLASLAYAADAAPA